MQFLKSKDTHHIQSFYVILSTGVFLGIFFGSETFGDLTEYFEFNLIGPIGMLIFLSAVSYIIVRYKAFNTKLIGAQALVIVLWALVGSLLFVAQSNTTKIVAAATLLFTTFAGYLLIKSVQNEVRQREELEKLTIALGKANERLKELDKLKSEFVSIASHQLRSPLTSIRGYASMLVEESFGKLPEKALEPLKRIEDSARHMAMSIEDYLNVSRIEAGNMKYNMADFNLRDEVEKVSDDVRPVAMEKGLVLLFRTDLKGQGVVKADIGKTVQIIHNLINNSMKYTPKGSITVLVHDNIQKKRIFVDIIDTGIGINQENLAKLFQKFSRADNANSVNVSGTGLGLFVALRMAEAMGGNITAHSDGDGKGSRFTLELPLLV
jgi:signal transduction histidine kinase